MSCSARVHQLKSLQRPSSPVVRPVQIVVDTCEDRDDEDSDSVCSENDPNPDFTPDIPPMHKLLGGATTFTSSYSFTIGSAKTGVADSKVEVESRNPDSIDSLDPLDTICTIGAGTFGRVVLCQHEISKRYYALKALPIKDIILSKQVDHTFSERKILEKIQHPFIVNLHWSHKNERFLYMLFDYVPGGELFGYLREAGCFTSDIARFYAAEIILALDYLHQQNIVYRDLKPENLLLDSKGHLKITDFGFAKELDESNTSRTFTLCGTPEYLAPEIIQNHGHSRGVDFWALGILLFEMLAGYPPFFGSNTTVIYEQICDSNAKFPSTFDLVAKYALT